MYVQTIADWQSWMTSARKRPRKTDVESFACLIFHSIDSRRCFPCRIPFTEQPPNRKMSRTTTKYLGFKCQLLFSPKILRVLEPALLTAYLWRSSSLIGSLRCGHYGLRTTVIHGEDLVRDLLRMLDSTWVSQSVVWLQATGSSRGDSRSEDYVSIFLPIFDQFCFLNATFMLNSL